MRLNKRMALVEIKKVLKIGNSYAITLSKPLLAALNITAKDHVSIRLTNDTLEIRKLAEVKL
jgi:antitoxin component of MazEF toxin-antitoxin module